VAAEAPSLAALLPVLGLDGPSWAAWRVVAKCLDGTGDTFTADERALFETCTGRTRVPTERPAELVVVKGRRAGGSRFGSAVATWAAGFMRYALAPGERAVVGLAAADREQARVCLQYAAAPFEASAELRSLVRPPSAWTRLAELVTRRTRWGFDLTTGVTVEVRTASFGTIRGRTYAAVIADEVAFWQREDGSNPASEVLAAVRPGLVTLGGQLVVLSSPYAKHGPLWEAVERYYGKDDDRVLVWRAASRVMNSTIPERVVLDALERDEASARAEWLAEFRDDISGLLAPERLRAVVIAGRTEPLPPADDTDYLAVGDVASGGGGDSAALAVAHLEDDAGRLIAVIDAVHEVRPPFDPEAVVAAFGRVLSRYGLREVQGDRWGAGWTDAAFRRAGLIYRPLELTKAEAYVEFVRLVNARQVELPDHPRLVQQAAGLQRRAGAAGRELVDHRPGGHDDVANVVAMACVLLHRLASAPRPEYRVY
jgi:hypothetical protein